MNKQKIYCELEFYDRFLTKQPKYVTPSEETINTMKDWIDFYSFMYKSSIYFNASIEDFKNKCDGDEYYARLWKKSASGECDIEFLGVEYPIIDNLNSEFWENNNNLHAIYLSCLKQDKCEEIMNAYGVIVINIDTLFNKCSQFFNMRIELIEQGQLTHNNWSFVKNSRQPFNTIAIIDNFILSNQNGVNNLLDILNAILPVEKMNIPLQILVYSNNQFPSQNQRFHDTILRSLKEIRNEQTFELTVYKVNNNQFHDRTIITNYLLMNSESGFNLFNRNQAIHQTRVFSFYPSMVSNCTFKGIEPINVLIQKMTIINNNAVANENLTNYWGTGKNRFLSN